MNAAWTTAFVILSVLVLGLGVLVIGLMRRIAPVLDRLELADGSGLAAVRGGLSVGMRAGTFSALTSIGQRMTRDTICDDDHGAVLVVVEPGCAPCEALIAQLGEMPWPGDLPTLYLVLSDSTDARERRLEETGAVALYQADSAVSNAFAVNITPVAFVMDADATILARQVPPSARDLVALARSHGRHAMTLPLVDTY